MSEGEALLVDVNQGWTMGEAHAMAPKLNELALDWVEEPIAADRPEEEWRRLAEAYIAPLAGGENLRGQELLQAASNTWLNIIQPDVGKWGGVSGCFAVDLRTLVIRSGRSRFAGGRLQSESTPYPTGPTIPAFEWR
jgi:D-galactarolactone cycloisomerase